MPLAACSAGEGKAGPKLAIQPLAAIKEGMMAGACIGLHDSIAKPKEPSSHGALKGDCSSPIATEINRFVV
jgi:hypothetical protein